MKITKLLVVMMLLLGVNTASAQVDEACLANSSISHEAVKAGNYKDAYGPWKEVIRDCPLLRFYTYTDGFKILTSFLDEGEKGSDEYNKYFEELMALHDSRMENTPKFIANGVKISSVEEALGRKAVDYLNYAPSVDADLVYDWVKKSVNGEKEKSQPAVLFYLVELSSRKLAGDDNHKETFINDYLYASQLTDDAIEGTDRDAIKAAYTSIKENLTSLFIGSGAADCQSLQDIYAPKVEENKDNLEYLEQVLTIMKNLRCTEQEAYAQASFYSYQIEPTAEAAVGCGFRAYKNGNVNEAIKFFDESIELETDATKKAEKAYVSASILYSAKRYGQSRTYALKALNYDSSYGSALVLIAKLYASNPNWSDDPVMNKCTYFLVIDKLQRARSIDPSVAEEANKLINMYSQYTPTAQDLFMLGYKTGDSVTIGGWIGESTTIR